jgi:hypothetical protein
MKIRVCIVAGAALLSAASIFTSQANAQQAYGGGYSNIWSAAQGTSDGYGNANAYDLSTSGALATAGGGGLSGTSGGYIGGGITSAFTTSTAATNSSGSGYAQAQTSGYAGGAVAGYGGRGR